jgi:hypothetical protein
LKQFSMVALSPSLKTMIAPFQMKLWTESILHTTVNIKNSPTWTPRRPNFRLTLIDRCQHLDADIIIIIIICYIKVLK